MRRAGSPQTDADCVDWAGVAHARCPAPRIASLVPSLTELLFELGLGASVVARTGFCVHPRGAVRSVPKIGGTKDPDLTKLAAQAPSHLVVNVDENRREVVDAARAFVPNVIVTHPSAPADNLRLYRLFGAVFVRESAAQHLVERFTRALDVLDAAAAVAPPERVVYVIWRRPWMCVTPATYVGATLERGGWTVLPADRDTRYPVLRDDDPAWTAADRILLSTEPYAFRPRDAVSLAASRRKPVNLIDGEWASWYGARAIEGLTHLAGFRRSLAPPTVRPGSRR
ncbi:MAG: helical backbone metal receptor [Casimicrobiaceae bacterium]